MTPFLNNENSVSASAARCAAIRRRIAQMSHRANSAHFGSSLSAVECLDAMLAISDLRPASAASLERDRIVVSKGHAAMVTYAAYEAWGLLPTEMIDHYLDDGTALWGHVTRVPSVPAIDASTGSLGHGLSIAAGFSLANRLNGVSKRVFCLLSDGECDEGSTWEAALFAGHGKFAELFAVVDYNKVQSIGLVKDVLDIEPFLDKWTAFRWRAIEADGHDTTALSKALSKTDPDGRPTVIIAHTIKGKGVARIEGTVASHYIPARADDAGAFDA